jgi:hypothetical protein
MITDGGWSRPVPWDGPLRRTELTALAGGEDETLRVTTRPEWSCV